MGQDPERRWEGLGPDMVFHYHAHPLSPPQSFITGILLFVPQVPIIIETLIPAVCKLMSLRRNKQSYFQNEGAVENEQGGAEQQDSSPSFYVSVIFLIAELMGLKS